MAKAFICDGCGRVLEGSPASQLSKRKVQVLYHEGEQTYVVHIQRYVISGLDDLCLDCYGSLLAAIGTGRGSVDLRLPESVAEGVD